MPGAPTPILNLIVPTVGGDQNIWGTELNSNLATIDNLGALPNVSFGANLTGTISSAPEKIYRGTTGSGTVTFTLPTLAAIYTGKVFTVIKVDSGTGTLNIAGTINGLSGYALTNQWQYARVQWNGSSYDLIGNN